MALNNIYVEASPESVYDVLADPRHYANWVMAASATRRFEGRWPERGSVLHHTQMMLINDTTEVLDSERPGRLLLEARARPVVVSRVDISVRPESGGTRVVLEEHPTGGLMAALPRRLSDVLLYARNAESLRRLKWLAEMGEELAKP